MMKKLFLFFLFLFCPAWVYASQPEWQNLATGLDYILWEEEDSHSHIEGVESLNFTWRVHTVRISTTEYDFDLLGKNFNQPGEKKSRSLWEWAKEYGLMVAINASMYMDDGFTSNGYMIKNDEINFGRIVSKLGGFFVADPKKSSLPSAAIIEKSENNWEGKLKNYRIVVQNFRIIGTKPGYNTPQVIWQENGKIFSTIAAIGEDDNKNIYFFLSQNPSTVHEFATFLLSKKEEGMKLSKVLYVEGGNHAALHINPEKTKPFRTSFDWFYFYYMQNAILVPNIIGVKEK